MGLPCRVGRVGASSATVEAHDAKLRTEKWTLIFVFEHDFFRFWSDVGAILEGFRALKFDFLRSFFENVDFAKIVLPSRRNCYF